MRVQPHLPSRPFTATVMDRPGSAWCACSAANSPAPPEPRMRMSVLSLRIQPPGNSETILNRQDAKKNQFNMETRIKSYRTTERRREPKARMQFLVSNSRLRVSLRLCSSIIVLFLLAAWRLISGFHAEGGERGGALRPRRRVDLVVEAAAVAVHRHQQRAEALHAELPQ